MRVAILISVWVSCLVTGTVRGDDGDLVPLTLDDRPAFLVSEKYAADHKWDFVNSFFEHQKGVDFWTPSEEDIVVAARTFREWIHDGARDPGAVYPEMRDHPDGFPPGAVEFQRKEMELVNANYKGYSRQYVGIVVEGRKLVLCNYFSGLVEDPAKNYVFIQKVFHENRGIHFLQCWFDPDTKKCSKLAMVGMWQTAGPGF